MRYEIVHTTHYAYESEVLNSHHVARLTPRTLPGQRLLEHSLMLDPQPAHRSTMFDYFGNEAVFFSEETPYRELRVTARSVVELDTPQPELPFEIPSWESVRDSVYYALTGSDLSLVQEYTWSSPLINRHSAFSEYAACCFTPGRPLFEALLHLTARIHADFVFDASATTIATPLLEVLESRRGVCQDFAQIQIACLRSLGLPARYVSGYIETLPPPGEVKLVGADASHAWISAYCPPLGWVDLDPTNNVRPSGQHITLGWGRDFTDVSPLRGIFVGSGAQELSVSVDVNRIG